MTLLEMKGITFGYGSGAVLSDVSFTVESGEHVGLVGANGAGKSTILRLVTGDEVPQAGSVRVASIPTGSNVVLVPQFFPADAGGPVREFVIADIIALRRELQDLESRMATATESDLSRTLKRYGDLRERYDALDGDDAEYRAESLLARVDMASAADTDVRSLSGGEQNRAQIARAFAARPELLILDEPGNHLDLWGLDWLERTLSDYPGAVLVISHNRFLLDRVATRILELRTGSLTSWTGNYSAYRANRLREAVQLARDARADAQHLKRLEAQVQYLAQLARAVPDSSVGKRLRARRTQLEHARRDARERPELTEARAAIRLDAPPVRADIALELRELEVTVGQRQLLKDASLLIRCGERVALVGPNGCGKTTLLRQIVTRGSWDDDHLRVGPSMKIGYCAQHQELFPADLTLEEALSRAGAGSRDKVFGVLSRYRFGYHDLDHPVGTLSGGERNRLQLAHAEVVGANVLILDEPTNHLDIPGREAVEEALLAFPGTILVVSHDRYFLDRIVTRVVAFEGTALASYDLSFRAWWSEVTRRQGRDVQAPVTASEPTVEERLLNLEQEMATLERELSRTYQRNDLTRAEQLSRRLDSMRTRYNRLYAQWG